MKRKNLLQAPENQSKICIVCGETFTSDTAKTCSRGCGAILRRQIKHPEDYDTRDMSPYALARAIVYYARRITGAQRPEQRAAQ